MSNVFISIDQLCASWRIRTGRSIHFHYIAAKLATDAVRELTLSSLPIINHKILEKKSDESWFALPGGYTDWVSAGVFTGEYWRSVRVHNRLIPFPNTIEGGSSFDDSFDIGSTSWTNWLNPAVLPTVSNFSGQFYSGSDFATDGETGSGMFSSDYFNPNYFLTEGATNEEHNQRWFDKLAIADSGCCARTDVIAINAAQNIIVTPMAFPGNKLYLVYIACGAIDTMTQVPLVAQAAIEAHMDWKYAQSKRNGLSEARILKQEFDDQHRILRARLNDLTTTDIRNIQDDNYRRIKT